MNKQIPTWRVTQAKEQRIYSQLQQGNISNKPKEHFRILKRDKTHAYYQAWIKWLLLAENGVSPSPNWEKSMHKAGGKCIDNFGVVHSFNVGWDIPFKGSRTYKFMGKKKILEHQQGNGTEAFLSWFNYFPNKLNAVWVREAGCYVFKGVYELIEEDLVNQTRVWQLRANKYNVNTGAMSTHPDLMK
jgi:hypothetical protein